jgi:putative Holliday junction resolvase
MRPGVRIGLDPGSARIGVAVSDDAGVLATPREPLGGGPGSFDQVVSLVQDVRPLEIVIGIPLTMSGVEGPSAQRVREWATRLADHIDVHVRLVDERLSTVQAQRSYREQGRSTRSTRDRIDGAAATVVLQFALDAERSSGEAPGEVL